MTAIAEAGGRSRAQGVRCEVYCADSDQLLGYLVAGGTAACLERALIENGFSLVPVGSRRSEAERALVAA